MNNMTHKKKGTLPNRNIMSPGEVGVFVQANCYEITPGTENMSRCVDGRYTVGDNEQLPPLAKPGGDAGDFLTAFAALQQLGIYPDETLIYKAVMATVGGEAHFSFHTDTHAQHDHKGPGRGCGHLAQADATPHAYNVTKADTNFIFNALAQLKQKGAHEVTLEGDHNEGAVIVVIRGDNYSILPQGADGKQAFVYHAVLDNKRLELLAQKIYEIFTLKGAKIEFSTLHTTIKELAQKQLNETVKRLALNRGLSIYIVSFDKNGGVDCKLQDNK